MDLHLAPEDLPLAVPALQTVHIGGADDLADVFPRQHPYAVDVTDRAGAVRTVELNAQIRRQVVAFPPGGPEYVVNGPMDAIVTLEGAEWGADIAVGCLVAALGIFVLATELPLMQELLRRNSLSIGRWLALAATASVVSFAMELYQRVRRGKPASRSFP